MSFSGFVSDLFKQLASVLSTKVDMSGMRALLAASIVAIVAGCELKEFNNAAGHLSTCMDSGVVGVSDLFSVLSGSWGSKSITI